MATESKTATKEEEAPKGEGASSPKDLAGATASKGKAASKISPAQRGVSKGLAIATLVVTILSFICLIVFAVFCCDAMKYVADNSVTFTFESDMGNSLAEAGFSNVEPYQAAMGIALVGLLLAIAGIVLYIFSLIACISMLRTLKVPEKRFRSFVWCVLAAVVSMITFNLVLLVLFIVCAVKLYRGADTGEKEEDYATSGRLGFMRFIEIYCILNILSCIAILLFNMHSSYSTANLWLSILQVVLMSVTAWVIIRRLQYGRQIIIYMTIGFVVVEIITQIATNTFSLVTFPFEILPELVIIIYFATSRRAKAVLVRPFQKESRAALLREDEQLWNLKSFDFWRNLVLYFCFFSVAGHWLEWCFCWSIRLGILPFGTYDPNSGIWHDLLNPFFVYGAAVVFIGLVLFPLKNFFQRKLPNGFLALLASFLVNSLACAALELTLGLILNQPSASNNFTSYPLWNYTTEPLNFMGQICLSFTLMFGAAATVVTWLVYPNLERLVARIPRDAMNIITVVIIVFFVILLAMYVFQQMVSG